MTYFLATTQVASVIGITVNVDLLAAIYPIKAGRKDLETDLKVLEAAKLMRKTEGAGAWSFTQV